MIRIGMSARESSSPLGARVLCGVDGSDESILAARQGARLTERDGILRGNRCEVEVGLRELLGRPALDLGLQADLPELRLKLGGELLLTS